MTAHRPRLARPAAVWLLAAACQVAWPRPAAAEAGEALPLARVPPAGLHLDSGRLDLDPDGAMVVRDPVVRGTVPGSDGQAARLDFTFLGPSVETAPLASGEVRRQVGLKLRARDGCNVLYVMWRLAPATALSVQVKSNPGLRTHRECRDGGYATVTPDRSAPVPAAAAGEPQSLEARIEGRLLRVRVNGVPAWEGSLPEAALALEGPVGLRADNGQFRIALWASGSGAPGGER